MVYRTALGLVARRAAALHNNASASAWLCIGVGGVEWCGVVWCGVPGIDIGWCGGSQPGRRPTHCRPAAADLQIAYFHYITAITGPPLPTQHLHTANATLIAPLITTTFFFSLFFFLH